VSSSPPSTVAWPCAAYRRPGAPPSPAQCWADSATIRALAASSSRLLHKQA